MFDGKTHNEVRQCPKEEIMGRGRSKKMVEIERRYGQSLAELLTEKVTAQGQTETARELGIGKSTLGYWLLVHQIEVRNVALGPGDTLTIERAHSPAQVPHASRLDGASRVAYLGEYGRRKAVG